MAIAWWTFPMGPEETIFMDAADVVRRQIRGLQAAIGHLGHARILLEDMEHPSLGDVECLMARLQGECATAVREMQRRNLK